jgi:SAM-dependent MidA family methyltransferase
MNASLPEPSALAQSASRALKVRIAERIGKRRGWIPFSEYMQLALYEPGLGYYTGGAAKLGVAGDFVTAPEISALFGQALAHQVEEVLAATRSEILEVGAGSGQLALQILGELARRDALPEHYRILEVSPELRERQAQLFKAAPPDWARRVSWLDELPESLSGVIIANEVLDAMPAEIVVRSAGHWLVRGVVLDPEGQLGYQDRSASAELAAALRARVPGPGQLGDGYTTELNETAQGFVATLAKKLEHGAMILIDYGFPAAEYYHPERRQGTFMAHYRHRAHDDPFFWPGLQDLTTHVDFSALAAAARAAQADVLGYTSQSHFLLNCGILELLEGSAEDPSKWLPQTNALQRLLSEAEMGELYKVLAVGRGLSQPLLGFARGDRGSAL